MRSSLEQAPPHRIDGATLGTGPATRVEVKCETGSFVPGKPFHSIEYRESVPRLSLRAVGVVSGGIVFWSFLECDIGVCPGLRCRRTPVSLDMSLLGIYDYRFGGRCFNHQSGGSQRSASPIGCWTRSSGTRGG